MRIQPPLLLTGSGLIIVLIPFIRRLPYAVRSSASILRQVKGSIEEAAISLGAPPARAFLQVTLPLMLAGIVAGALLSFITAINELSSTLVLYVGRTMTMPGSICRFSMASSGPQRRCPPSSWPRPASPSSSSFASRRPSRARLPESSRPASRGDDWKHRPGKGKALSSSSAWGRADQGTNSPNRAL
jgi:Binding-protein-dependent transport system inner membrane component